MFFLNKIKPEILLNGIDDAPEAYPQVCAPKEWPIQ